MRMARMKPDRTPVLIVGGAVLAALVVPLWLLRVGGAPPPTAPPPRPAPMLVADAAAVDKAVARRPFGDTRPPATPEAETAPTDDGPDLAGIVGRFPRSGRAMVRIGRGRTRALKVGDRIDGWRLTALTPARATFRRGDRRVVRRVD